MLKNKIEVKLNTKAFEKLVKRFEIAVDKFDIALEKHINKLITEMSKKSTISCDTSVDKISNELASAVRDAISSSIGNDEDKTSVD